MTLCVFFQVEKALASEVIDTIVEHHGEELDVLATKESEHAEDSLKDLARLENKSHAQAPI